ncbi:GNAT family N-acetyltransferase [Shewanella cyperi]|uniref:GNAT family N-acetyltransferase n=1 Tax=Shewanella cyperi TaxID=2814292 RepID=UPI001A951952|nr:N-acetyltransferase [Shewanella cyperi]QSX41028.1 GNAT family N-acetyltransferase [Shewanella cyperi]
MLTIRPLQKADMAAVFRVEQACFGDHCFPDFFFRQALDAWPLGLLGAFDDTGFLLGYCLCSSAEEAGCGWIMSLAVIPEARGRGAGKALMQNLLNQQRYSSLKLTVAPDNPALALYLGLGFIRTGEESDYFGPGEHRLLLCLDAD